MIKRSLRHVIGVPASSIDGRSVANTVKVQMELKILSLEELAYISRQTRRSHSGGRRFDPGRPALPATLPPSEREDRNSDETLFNGDLRRCFPVLHRAPVRRNVT